MMQSLRAIKSNICKVWALTGFCKFGQSCWNLHPTPQGAPAKKIVEPLTKKFKTWVLSQQPCAPEEPPKAPDLDNAGPQTASCALAQGELPAGLDDLQLASALILLGQLKAQPDLVLVCLSVTLTPACLCHPPLLLLPCPSLHLLYKGLSQSPQACFLVQSNTLTLHH